jgi:hypothetical protein
VSDFVDIVAVRVLDGYVLELTWADGAVTAIDVEPYLWGTLAPLRAPELFATVTVDPEAGTVVWPNGADISPEELRRKSRPVTTERAEMDLPAGDRPSDQRDRRIADLDTLMRAAGIVPGAFWPAQDDENEDGDEHR